MNSANSGPESSGEQEPTRYDAFASYATDPDRRVVRDVEQFLESVVRNRLIDPAYRKPLQLCVDGSDFTIPRGKRELAISSKSPIEEIVVGYMKQSRYLLIFVGPKSSQHPWINFELEWWIANRGARSVLLAVTHGRDPQKERKQTFPQAVLDHGIDQWPWFDLRGFNRRAELNVGVRDYEEERIRLLANFLGPDVSANQVVSGWKRARQKQRRWQAVFGGCVAAGVIALALLALGLFVQSQQRAKTAFSRQLASESLEKAQPQQDLSLLLAVSALRASETVEARTALFEALARAGNLSTIMPRATTTLTSVVAVPKTSMVVAGGYDGTLQIYDFKEPGKSPLALPAHKGAIDSLAADSVRGLVVSGGRDQTIAFWKIESRECVRRISFPWGNSIRALAVSNNGEYLAAASGPYLRVMHLPDGNWSDPINPTKQITVNAVAFNPENDKSLAFGYEDGEIDIWDMTEQRSAFGPMRGHDTPFIRQTFGIGGSVESRTDAPVETLSFSPKGDILATGGYDGRVVLWDAKTGKAVEPSIKVADSSVNSLLFNNTGKTVITASSDGVVRIWSVADRRPLSSRYAAHKSRAMALAWVDEKTMGSIGWDGLLLRWDWSRWALGKQLQNTNSGQASEMQSRVRQIGFVGVDFVASSSFEHPLYLWNLAHPDDSRDLVQGTKVIRVAFGDGVLCFADRFNRVVLLRLDVSPKSAPPTLILPSESFVDDLRFVGDKGHVIATMHDGTVHQIDFSKGIVSSLHPRALAKIDHIVLSSDGNSLATANDSTVMVSSVEGRKTFTRERGTVANISISSDGNLLAINRYQITEIWDTRRGILVKTLDHAEQGVGISIMFSPDSSALVSFGGDYHPVFWDLNSGSSVAVLRNPVSLSSGAFAFDSTIQRFAEGHVDGSISLWDVSTEKLNAKACAIANRPFSSEEVNRYFPASAPIRMPDPCKM
jgi:WD40 repeat protein